jgi:hypothetical protein
MHRRACRHWREQNAVYIREGQIRDRLEPKPEPAKESFAADPMKGIDWSAARAVMGLEAATVVERAGEVLHGWARDALRAQAAEIRRESG